MDQDRKIEIAADAVSAINEAVKAHSVNTTRRERQAAIAQAEYRLDRLKSISTRPFLWSLHHDIQEVDIKREIKRTIQQVQLEIIKQGDAFDGIQMAEAMSLRYLERFGPLIGVPDLKQLYLDHCEAA